ncbi:Cysteine protease XCP1 [Zea mays]|uniref:Cysteine protease XCP1 n=1 Tax=Zea mays TaxID=4577 RepID=A0A3L6EX16_MAIZE|nr:Cysteine protease XCP1 [Zea mays]
MAAPATGRPHRGRPSSHPLRLPLAPAPPARPPPPLAPPGDPRRGRLPPQVDVVTITGYEDVLENSEISLLKALAHQPVSIGITAGSRDFQFYRGGVFDGACSVELHHELTAVGYGSSYGQNYITMKNSWGKNWGEQGYVRIKMGTGKPEGVCGIYTMASYPLKNATRWGT